MKVMYDSVSPERIPKNAQAVAGYLDGPYAWHPEDWDKFPNALHVGICIDPSHNLGEVLDVEPGDSTPGQAVDWVIARRKSGVTPVVYCCKSALPFVQSAFRSRSVAEPGYWVAEWNGTASIRSGEAAHQYKNGIGYDVSVIADEWPCGAGSAAVPEPHNSAKPECQRTLMKGSRIFYRGRVYADSFGHGPGKTVCGDFVVDRYLYGRKFGAHIAPGWIDVGPIKLL